MGRNRMTEVNKGECEEDTWGSGLKDGVSESTRECMGRRNVIQGVIPNTCSSLTTCQGLLMYNYVSFNLLNRVCVRWLLVMTLFDS
jgi:hypothetical protein